ncbi:hypothetical protein ACRAWD_27025 [Caulobacter segnis]
MHWADDLGRRGESDRRLTRGEGTTLIEEIRLRAGGDGGGGGLGRSQAGYVCQAGLGGGRRPDRPLYPSGAGRGRVSI